MCSCEDWISVTAAMQSGGSPLGSTCETVSPLLKQLDDEAERMREKAIAPARGIDFREWAAFSEDMQRRLADQGIMASAEAL